MKRRRTHLAPLLLICLGALCILWTHRKRLRKRQARHTPVYMVVTRDGSLKIGTCVHCVVHEQGRPARAWNADGDADLDFPRDRLIQQLADVGLQVEIADEYICP